MDAQNAWWLGWGEGEGVSPWSLKICPRDTAQSARGQSGTPESGLCLCLTWALLELWLSLHSQGPYDILFRPLGLSP